MGSTKNILCVYIGGYGRSGSTLLDTLVSNYDGAFGCGELTYFFDELLAGRNCSCMQPIKECSVWSVVEADLREFDWKTSNEITRSSERIFGKVDPRYASLWLTILRSVQRVSGASVIVDSSKSSHALWNRAKLLNDLPGVEVKLIHLVRDPRAVMWSLSRGSNWKIERAERQNKTFAAGKALISWMLANKGVEAAAKGALKGMVMRVRYEDLVADPVGIVNDIGDFVGIDMSEVVAKFDREEAFSAGHGVGGNRMRRQGPIKLKLDKEWEEKLPSLWKLFALLSWPMARRYGYRWKA